MVFSPILMEARPVHRFTDEAASIWGEHRPC